MEKSDLIIEQEIYELLMFGGMNGRKPSSYWGDLLLNEEFDKLFHDMPFDIGSLQECVLRGKKSKKVDSSYFLYLSFLLVSFKDITNWDLKDIKDRLSPLEVKRNYNYFHSSSEEGVIEWLSLNREKRLSSPSPYELLTWRKSFLALDISKKLETCQKIFVSLLNFKAFQRPIMSFDDILGLTYLRFGIDSFLFFFDEHDSKTLSSPYFSSRYLMGGGSIIFSTFKIDPSSLHGNRLVTLLEDGIIYDGGFSCPAILSKKTALAKIVS